MRVGQLGAVIAQSGGAYARDSVNRLRGTGYGTAIERPLVGYRCGTQREDPESRRHANIARRRFRLGDDLRDNGSDGECHWGAGNRTGTIAKNNIVITR